MYDDGTDELDPYVEANKVYVDAAESPALASGFQYLVVNPLGSLSRIIAESTGTETAQQAVKTALGLPDVDLLNYDPLDAIANNEANGLEIYSKQVQVQNVIVQMEALGSSDEAVIESIVQKIENNETVDLSDSTQITALIEELVPSLETDEVSGVTEVITQVNQTIDDIVTSTGSDDTEKATEIAQVQKVAQGEIVEDLTELGAGTKTVTEVVNENTDTELTTQIDDAEVNDPTEIPDPTAILPVAEADTATTDVAQPVTIDVLANDSHPDNDTLTITEVLASDDATVEINDDNTVTYTPNSGFSGEDIFYYAIEDSNGDVASTFVGVTVEPNEIVGTPGGGTVTGTEEDDNITGTSGRNIITGLGGNDRFIYDSIRDRGDIITDFTIGEDTIVLSDLLDSLDYAGSDPISDGYVQFGSRDNDAVLLIDTDGLGARRSQSFLTLQDITVEELNNTDNFEF